MLENTIEKSPVQISKEDFASDQMVKWCPGCGGHAILAAVENVFPRTGYKKENFAMISGIGCSSRFPYYVNTYGIHGIHGRANPIATGVKVSNPELSVWIATGDGDSMAIGGNHFIHTIRRNLDVNILLFNNQIYGLTKGQFSPTTPMGKVTKTSPYGTIEHPFLTAGLVMGAQGTFFARVPDNNIKLMTDVLYEAAKHDGTSVVEILENCVIFNDKAHADYTARANREENQLILRHGEPMIFGKDMDMGVIMKDRNLYCVKIGVGGIKEKDILVHDQYSQDPGVHRRLGRMLGPDYPIAFGVIRSAKADTYDDKVEEQIKYARETSPIKNMDDLLNSGETWEI